MKGKMFLTGLIFSSALYAQQNDYSVRIKLSDLKEPATAYLKYSVYRSGIEEFKKMTAEELMQNSIRFTNVLDSANSSNGEFSFKGDISKGPVKAELYIVKKNALRTQEKDSKTILLGKESVVVSGKDMLSGATVSGSVLNKEYEAYKKVTEAFDAKIASITNEASVATEERKKVLAKNIELERVAKAEAARQYAIKHPDSYVSLFVLLEATISYYSIDVAVVEPVYKKFSPQIKNTLEGVRLGKMIGFYQSTATGAVAPEFSVKDPEGNDVNLSDFRGRYVLIDFWASWCGPCRAENPNFRVGYEKYKDKNFTILGVSFDNPGAKASWIKAIKDDNLTWPQASDLRGLVSSPIAAMFNIRAIPQNYLLDPNGKIIARNLRGDKYLETLAGIFGK